MANNQSGGGKGQRCPYCGSNTFHHKQPGGGRCTKCNGEGVLTDHYRAGSGRGIKCERCNTLTLKRVVSLNEVYVWYCHNCVSFIAWYDPA